MTGKHTPGPWVYGDDPEGSKFKISVHSDDGYYICLVDEGHCQEANARLIAAAPDLLDVLEEASDPINGYLHGPVLARARAAIAKARGQE